MLAPPSGGNGRKLTPRRAAPTDARSAVRRTERRSRESISSRRPITQQLAHQRTGRDQCVICRKYSRNASNCTCLSCERLTSALPFSPILRQVSALAASFSIPVARSSTSPGSAIKPVSASITISGTPAIRLATTSTDIAMLSSSTFGSPSLSKRRTNKYAYSLLGHSPFCIDLSDNHSRV